MSFKIKTSNFLWTIRMHFLRYKVKFDCSMDIFLKIGSQKYQIFTSIPIQNEQITFNKISSIKEVVYESKKQSQKKNAFQQNPILIFELCSKNYNAYAGELELQLNKPASEIRSKLQNSLDENAVLSYSVQANELQSQKQLKSLKQQIHKKHDNQGLKNKQKSIQISNDKTQANLNSNFSSNKKVKFIENTSNIKSMNSLHKMQSPEPFNSTNSILKKRQLFKKPFESRKQIQTKSKFISQNDSQIQQQQNQVVIQNTQTKKKSEKKYSFNLSPNANMMNSALMSKSKGYESLNISKIITIEKQLDEQRQKCHKFQIQVQTKKNQIKQLEKSYKDLQKKYSQVEADYKKKKKQQEKSSLFIQKLKDDIDLSKLKYQRKIQSLQTLNKRSDSKQKSYKTQMAQIYKKMQETIKQKLQKEYQNNNLEEKMDIIENKVIVEHQEQIKSFQNTINKVTSKNKNLQEQFFKYKESLVNDVEVFGKNLAQLLLYSKTTYQRIDGDFKDRQRGCGNKLKMNLSLGISTSFSQSYEEVLEDYQYKFDGILEKSQKIVIDLYSKLNKKTQQIRNNEAQLKSLVNEFNATQVKLEQTQKDVLNEKLKQKQLIQKFQLQQQNMKKQHQTKEKQYRKIIDESNYTIQDLNKQLTMKSKQIFNLNKFKQMLQKNIENLQKSILDKNIEHKNVVEDLFKEKQKIVNHLKQQITKIEEKLSESVSKSQKLKKVNEKMQKKIVQIQGKIKQLQKSISIKNQQNQKLNKENIKSQENQKLLTKQVDSLKHLIEEITGQKINKEKQFNKKEDQLKDQVNTFKQNHKNLQQAKKALQQNKKKIDAQILSLQNQAKELKEKLTKSQSEQRKSTQALKNLQKQFQYQKDQNQQNKKLVKELKEEVSKLKIKLKKKQQFQNQLQDQFQCTFNQLREKLNYYIKASQDTEKEKNVLSRQGQAKLRKFNMSLQGMNQQLTILEQEFQKKKKNMASLKGYYGELMKLFGQIQKETSISSFYFMPIKDLFKKCQTQIMGQLSNMEKIEAELEKKKENRKKLQQNLRKTSNTIARRSSVTPQSQSTTFDKPSRVSFDQRPSKNASKYQRKFSLSNNLANNMAKPKDSLKTLNQDIKQVQLSIQEEVNQKYRSNQLLDQTQEITINNKERAAFQNLDLKKQIIGDFGLKQKQSKKSKAIKRLNTLR